MSISRFNKIQTIDENKMSQDKILFFKSEFRVLVVTKDFTLQKIFGSSNRLIVLGIDYRRPDPFTKREDDVREEQVGWENGRIPFGFQNLVPTGQAFPATSSQKH